MKDDGGGARMNPNKLFSIIAWIALPTVMFGGYSLLLLLAEGNTLTAFQETYFRAGHAHAGVLLLMALLYHNYLRQTKLSMGVQWVACVALFLGVLSVSGGFFLHMAVGAPGVGSAGTLLTSVGALVVGLDVLLLVWGLIRA